MCVITVSEAHSHLSGAHATPRNRTTKDRWPGPSFAPAGVPGPAETPPLAPPPMTPCSQAPREVSTPDMRAARPLPEPCAALPPAAAPPPAEMPIRAGTRAGAASPELDPVAAVDAGPVLATKGEPEREPLLLPAGAADVSGLPSGPAGAGSGDSPPPDAAPPSLAVLVRRRSKLRRARRADNSPPSVTPPAPLRPVSDADAVPVPGPVAEAEGPSTSS